MDAMMVCCGEVGYRTVSVEQVYKRYGGSRSHFYRHFESKADCFREGYARESERLVERLTSSPSGQCGLQQALDELSSFIVAEPLRARALFLEVHVAAGSCLERRREVIERLSQALDSACREEGAHHPAPPPITGEFMVSVIDQAVSSALINRRPEDFRRDVPALAALISQAYSGNDDRL